MTQVGKMLMDEARQEEATQTVMNMLKSGKFSVEEIQEYVPRLSIHEIQTMTIAKRVMECSRHLVLQPRQRNTGSIAHTV